MLRAIFTAGRCLWISCLFFWSTDFVPASLLQTRRQLAGINSGQNRKAGLYAEAGLFAAVEGEGAAKPLVNYFGFGTSCARRFSWKQLSLSSVQNGFSLP